MKKLIYLLPVLLLTAVYFSFTGWSVENRNDKGGVITDYYYYKGQPFSLQLKSNMIFVKTKTVLNETNLSSLVRNVIPNSTVAKYQKEDLKQFITLSSSENEITVMNYVKSLKSNPLIESASPVFSPDEGKTLIGVENEVILQFKEYLSETERNNFLNAHGLTILQDMKLTGGQSYSVRVPASENSTAIDVANEIYRTGLVNFAEPNLYFTNLLCYIPNDPFFPRQWSARNTGNNIPEGIAGTPGCDMQLDSAWEITKGINKCVVVISDTGIDTLHEELAAQCIPGTGMNFYNNPPTPGGNDDGNHGTCCSGIIAAIGNNNIGISGNCPNARLISSKWLNSSGSGNYTGATGSIVYGYQKGGWIISNSWGFIGGASAALDQALTDAVTLGRSGKGTVLCFASGNENGAMRYPASSHPSLVVVGGVSPCNQRKSTTSCDNETWWGASYGPTLDIVAPCVKIYATDRMGSAGYTPTNYDSTFNGTSSATPNTAGVCGLMLSVDSTLRWDSLRIYIGRTAQKVGSYSYTVQSGHNNGTWNNEMGYGKINGYQAVKYTFLKRANYPLSAFNLQTPAASTRIVTFPGSTTPVTITWDTSATGANYKFIFGNPTTATRRIQLSSGINNITMTLGALDSILALAGFTNTGTATDSAVGQWDVWAYKTPTAPGPDSMKATNGPRAITLRRGQVTVAPFALVQPLNNATIITAPNNNNNLTMSWRSGGSGLKYKWQFDSPTFAGPLVLNIPSGNNSYDTTLVIENAALDAMLQAYGLNRGDSLIGQWRAYAFRSPTDSTASSETRALTLRRVGTLPLNENFESSTFPPAEWSLAGTGTQYWTRADGVGGYGTGSGSAKYDYWTAQASTGAQTLTSNVFPSVSTPNNYLRFNYSAAYYSATAIDSCIIETSTNSGATWTRLIGMYQSTSYALGYNSSPVMSTLSSTSQFTPTSTQWATKIFTMPAGTNQVRFVAKSAYGNNLYIDNITAGIATGTGTQLTLYPDKYELSQNYPNPFNPTTKINFNVPKQSFVTLKVFDVTGREVATLVNNTMMPGYHSVDFNASAFASGVYFYRIESAEFVDTKRMMLIK